VKVNAQEDVVTETIVLVADAIGRGVGSGRYGGAWYDERSPRTVKPVAVEHVDGADLT